MTHGDEVLRSHVCGVDRVRLYAFPENYRLTAWQWLKFQKLKLQRARGTPLSYCTHTKEFYGRNFFVNHSTLIPRPETECLIEHTLFAARHFVTPIIVDIGTGSGCIAITAAKLRPDAKIFGIDISKRALVIAKKNAHLHHAPIEWIHGDLLHGLQPIAPNHAPYIFIANLPYIPTSEYHALPRHIKKFEPKIALHGGIKGTELYERLFSELLSVTRPWLLGIEIMYGQEKFLIRHAEKIWPHAHIVCKKDLAGVPRVIIIDQT